jgi:hypothetical protein
MGYDWPNLEILNLSNMISKAGNNNIVGNDIKQLDNINKWPKLTKLNIGTYIS